MSTSLFDSANKLLNESVNNLETIQFLKPEGGANITTDDVEEVICNEIKFNVKLQTKAERNKLYKRIQSTATKIEGSKPEIQFDTTLPMKEQITYFLDLCSNFIASMQNHFEYIININKRNQTVQNRLNTLTNTDKIKKADLLDQFDKNNIIIAQYINKWTLYMKSHISICNKVFDLFVLSKLNPEEMSVFSLRYFELYDYLTISELTYMSERRVYLMRTAGIKKMTKYLTDKNYSNILDYFNMDFLNEVFNVE